MKLHDDTMAAGSIGGFHFSGVRPETLGATEYTLVTLVLDKTGSVLDFAADLFKIKKTVVQACRKSPRSDYLLLRVLEFNSGVDEVHGFLPLNQIDVDGYEAPKCEGLTALHDALYAAVSATNAYAKQLAEAEYLTNGIVFVATDGGNNHGKTTTADVRSEIGRAVAGETLESLRTILIGVNAAQYRDAHETLCSEAGIDQYVDVSEATAARLAKLGEFISRSISAQSQSLGTGGPSQALTF